VFKPEAKALFLPTIEDEKRFMKEGAKFLVSGWGHTVGNVENPIGHTREKSPVLQKATVPFVSDQDCQNAYAYPKPWVPKDPKETNEYSWAQFETTSRMVCAGFLEKGHVDSCNGDSGGPLAWFDKNDKKVKIVGIVSWGYDCAQPNAPGVYAKVTKALDWISEVTGNCNEQTCQENNCVTQDSLKRSTLRSLTRPV